MAFGASCAPAGPSCHPVRRVAWGRRLAAARHDFTTPAVQGARRRWRELCIVGSRAVWIPSAVIIGQFYNKILCGNITQSACMASARASARATSRRSPGDSVELRLRHVGRRCEQTERREWIERAAGGKRPAARRRPVARAIPTAPASRPATRTVAISYRAPPICRRRREARCRLHGGPV